MYEHDIKLIVTDLDGTFLGKGSRLIQQNGDAFQRAQAQGMYTAFASGRLARIGRRMAMDLGIDNCHIIGLNGAQIFPSPFGLNAQEVAFPDVLRDSCLKIIIRHGCFYNVYTEKAVYTNQKMSAERELRFRSNFSAGGVDTIISPEAYEQSTHTPCLKLLFKPDSNEAAYQQARKEIQTIKGLYLTAASPSSSEIMLDGISKAYAVQILADSLGVGMHQVMCLGDYDNDAEMLSACGLSVAMKNASLSAKEAANYITINHDDAGVAFAVNAFLDGSIHMLKR